MKAENSYFQVLNFFPKISHFSCLFVTKTVNHFFGPKSGLNVAIPFWLQKVSKIKNKIRIGKYGLKPFKWRIWKCYTCSRSNFTSSRSLVNLGFLAKNLIFQRKIAKNQIDQTSRGCKIWSRAGITLPNTSFQRF